MTLEERFQANFTCSKCRGKTAVTRTVSMRPASVDLRSVLRHTGPRYVAVSCALCGYTEFYDVMAYALK